MGNVILNSNGAKARLTSMGNLNVPTACGPKVVVTCYIYGANARPLQVVAQSPATARTRHDFVATGYFLGCADDPFQCTAIALNGQMYKRPYMDGSGPAGYQLYVSSATLSVGSEHDYMVRWQSGLGFRSLFDGGVLYTFSMPYFTGFTVHGAESAAFYGGGPLNMVEEYWFNMQRRDASDNWFAVTEASEVSPHAPASGVDFLPTTLIGPAGQGYGTC